MKKNRKTKKKFLPNIKFQINDDDFYNVVNKIAKRLSHKFSFGIYSPDDIVQECFLLAREALARYDGRKPLENFLSVHLHNRLVNFKRDKFERPDAVDKQIQADKKNIMQPVDISLIDIENEESMKIYEDILTAIRNKEIIDAITPYIGSGFKRIYKQFIKTGKLPCKKRYLFLEHIRELIVIYGKQTH